VDVIQALQEGRMDWPPQSEIDMLDGSEWTWTEFAPHDTVHIHPDGRIEPAPGGWDHEHCVLCFETFSQYPGDLSAGYANQDDNWVCEECYLQFIRPDEAEQLAQSEQIHSGDSSV
jgi:hypothetical protein